MFKSLHLSWYDKFCTSSSLKLRLLNLDIIDINPFHLKSAKMLHGQTVLTLAEFQS